jgi:hypothetical protein
MFRGRSILFLRAVKFHAEVDFGWRDIFPGVVFTIRGSMNKVSRLLLEYVDSVLKPRTP